MLILANDDEYTDKISKLVGPAFNDITSVEDEQDPITYDKFWEINNGKKIPTNINKYYLFSYIDSKDKIRCLTIFTIHDMINDDNYVHPHTMEQIPTTDIKRAKELIKFYQTKIGLFKEDETNHSPEYKLTNKLSKLFKRFHMHSIYFEEKWLMNIQDIYKLEKIIKETEKIANANFKQINPNLTNFKIFTGRKKKALKKNDTEGIEIELLELKEYIVGEWEKLIDAANNSNNQIPIWILASGLSVVVPEIKQKYPDLEVMN